MIHLLMRILVTIMIIMLQEPPRSLTRWIWPFDFHLFGYVKHRLKGQSFETAGELFSAIEAVWRGIDRSALDAGLSSECRDSGDAMQPMVTTLKKLNKV
jgi:hypothetical protein